MPDTNEDIPTCPPPDAKPTKPKFAVPPGACDVHAHVFPANDVHRLSPKRGYTPPAAGLDAFFAMHATLGIERAVLTQPSVYGTDNTAVLDAVSAHPHRLRAVVSVGSATPDADLNALDAAGVKGVRVNLVDRGGMPFANFRDVHRFSERIAPLGWHLELLVHVHEFPDLHATFQSWPVDVVIGHLGYMKTSFGVDHQGFQALLDLLRGGRCWVKLTGSYRISTAAAPPYLDVAPLAEALIASNPDRVLWGSDWPHPHHYKAMPNDGYLLDQLIDWTSDQAMIKRILVDNPKVLYGF